MTPDRYVPEAVAGISIGSASFSWFADAAEPVRVIAGIVAIISGVVVTAYTIWKWSKGK